MESYSSYGSIQLCVPTFKQGQFKTGSATVYNISYNAALRVLDGERFVFEDGVEPDVCWWSYAYDFKTDWWELKEKQ